MILADHGTFHHVYDFPFFELPFGMRLPLPGPVTKFMLLQALALFLVFKIFTGLTEHIRGGSTASGWFWNFWEMLALYIRDNVVRPIIGDPHAHDSHDEHHESPAQAGHGHHAPASGHGGVVAYSAPALSVAHPADKYLPFIWSCYFYILFCNLLGAVPFLGSATGNVNVTLVLAGAAFVATFIYGAEVHGGVGFWKALVPTIDAPPALKMLLIPMMFVIEVVGLFIKHAVLAVRLFANIMGGHTVLGVILGFIAVTAHHGVWWVVAPASVFGQIGVGLLELLVAFIQAYVFVFLATIFIGMSLHEH